MLKTIRPEIRLQYLGTVSEGKQLELYTEFDGMGQIVANIRADESDESLWFEVEVAGRIVQVPLALIKQAIEAAATEIHSEQWYEKNVYPSNGA